MPCSLYFFVAIGAKAEVTPITTLPFVCNHPGTYVLAANLAFNRPSNAITIAANNVTVDLKGYSLTSSGTTSVAIFSANRANTCIQNGNIRGFLQAVYLSGTASAFATVQDLKIYNTISQAIAIEGNNALVQRNFIQTISVIQGQDTWGILISGDLGRITDNEILDVADRPIQGSGAYITNNRITNMASTGAYGIVAFQGSQNTHCFVINNFVQNANYGIILGGSTEGAARDNIVQGCTHPYTNVSIGSNNL